MKFYGIKNCLTLFISLGCLLTILFIIFFFKGIWSFSSDYIFKTEKTESMKMDSHPHSIEEKNKTAQIKIALFSDIESDYENLQKGIDYLEANGIGHLVVLGDITHLGVSEDLNKVRDILDSSSLNYYVVPGDRDLWKSSGLDDYQEVFGNSYSLVQLDGYNLLLLDNSNVYEGLSENQLQFIKDNVENADFVFFHIPIYSDSLILGWKIMGQYSSEVVLQKDMLLEEVRKANVKAIFSGNQHLFSETDDSEKGDLYHYVIGSLNEERSVQNPNFAILTLYTDGDYYVEQVVL